VCIGKHIGLMEVKKLVAFLVLNYDVSFNDSMSSYKSNNVQLHIIDPKAFQVENTWFFRQKGLNVWVEKRETQISSNLE
jgi:hypothetical protein